MNKKIDPKIAATVILLVLLVAGWFIFWQVSRLIAPLDRTKNQQNIFETNKESLSPDVSVDKPGIANPASVYCEKQGGKLEIRTAPDGSQSGYCMFANGSSCEEWKYFRGECTPAGKDNIQSNQAKKTTLKKISKGERYTSYEGSITVSGRYEEYNPETMLGGILCFSADKKTGYLVPREPDFWGPGEPDTRNPWFCFSDQAEAKKLFGINDKAIFQDKTVECVSGPATVTVSHYVTDKLESETYDKAQLDKIISFQKYSTNNCGQ